MRLIKETYEDFSKGSFGNGGQNIYVSAAGILQRIYNYDINNDGYPDLLFANSQSMGERPPLYIFDSPLETEKYTILPSEGTYDGIFCRLSGRGAAANGNGSADRSQRETKKQTNVLM